MTYLSKFSTHPVKMTLISSKKVAQAQADAKGLARCPSGGGITKQILKKNLFKIDRIKLITMLTQLQVRGTHLVVVIEFF